MGSGKRSTSTTRQEISPPQEAIWRFMASDIIPMSRGQDTWLSRIMEQSGRDEGEKQKGTALESIMEMAGRTGMGAGEVASLQKGVNETAIQQTLKNIMGAKQASAQTALGMISNLPIAPTQKTVSKGAEEPPLWQSGLKDIAVSGATMGMGSILKPPIPTP